MSWAETASATFVARHDARDEADAEVVLAQLELARARLERRFAVSTGELAVVLHGSPAQLDVAVPLLAVQRRLTAPAARRYVVGWASEHELHVLAPRLLAQRASNVAGSLEMLMLVPVALLARRVVAQANPALPPPFGPRGFARYLRWAWLVDGAAQHFSGQGRHVRPAVARRLREGGNPSFPPGRADAPLLGGSVFDLLSREEGEEACVALARADLSARPREILQTAFGGRSLRHSEDAWRAHLSRLASGGTGLRTGPSDPQGRAEESARRRRRPR